jgi:CRP-like cAMP-binding protein
MSESSITVEDLRSIDLFDDLDDSELAEWVSLAQPRRVEAGEVIAEQNEEPVGLQLLLEGEALALMLDRGKGEPVGRQTAPTWMGAIAVLTNAPPAVRMQAATACRLALVPAEDFRRLAYAHPVIQRRVMQQVAPVIGRLTELEQSRERLASLGTMAAGLAHELNNPAAAARRAAAQLTEALDAIGSAMARFVDAGVELREAAQLVELHRQAVSRAESATALETLDASDAEDDLLVRL